MGMTGYGSSINDGAGQDMGLVPIAGGKHFTPEDHPDRIAAAINDLLNFRENR